MQIFLYYSIAQTDLEGNIFWFSNDQLNEIFPPLGNCAMKLQLNEYKMFCYLPLNIVFKYVFNILWCWFVSLGILTGFYLLLNLTVLIFPQFRRIFLRSRFISASPGEILFITGKLGINNWFFLYQAVKNIDSSFYKGIVTKLVKKFENENVGKMQA